MGRSGIGSSYETVSVHASPIYSSSSAYAMSVDIGVGLSGAYAGFSFNSPALQSPAGTSRQAIAGSTSGLDERSGNRPADDRERSRMTGVAAQGQSAESDVQQMAEGEQQASPEQVIVRARQLNDQRTGFTTYGPRDVQWGTVETIRSLQALGERWNVRHPSGPRIQIGSISRKDGNNQGHRSHKTGHDVDLRPMRNDGKEGRTNINVRSYSSDLTQDLIDTILIDPTVELIFFNDPWIEGVTPWKGHDDHLHIRFKN
jgi:hypothetical protein